MYTMTFCFNIITITYFEGTLAFKIMPLKELAALIVAEEDPAFCAYYNIP